MRNFKLTFQSHMVQSILVLICFLNVGPVAAGENLDSLFVEARQAAMDTSTRAKAIEMCQYALSQIPEYHDFRILLGRCYSWNGNYAQAETELLQVVSAAENYQDARNALLDVYLWSAQDEKAVDLVMRSIEKYPADISYRVKQFELLVKQEKEDEALKIVEHILAIEPTHEGALAYKELARKSKIEMLTEDVTPMEASRSTTVRYAYNRLAETNTEWQFIVIEPGLDPWHWVSIEHKESFSFGPVIFKVNYANRFQNTATQVEVESYPTLRKGTYLYTGMGFSNSDLFPSFRLGLEVFQALPRDYEASLGFRYLQVPDKNIPIYVSSLGKYWQSYWFNATTYLSPSNSSLSKSWILKVRKYLSNPANHFELYVGSGVSPDANLGGEEISFLGSRSFGSTYKRLLNSKYDLTVGVQFSNLETRVGAYRGDTGLQIALTRNY